VGFVLQSVVLGRVIVTPTLLPSAKYTFPIDPYSIICHSVDQYYGPKRRPFKEGQFFPTSRIKNKDMLPQMNNNFSEQHHLGRPTGLKI